MRRAACRSAIFRITGSDSRPGRSVSNHLAAPAHIVRARLFRNDGNSSAWRALRYFHISPLIRKPQRPRHRDAAFSSKAMSAADQLVPGVRPPVGKSPTSWPGRERQMPGQLRTSRKQHGSHRTEGEIVGAAKPDTAQRSHPESTASHAESTAVERFLLACGHAI